MADRIVQQPSVMPSQQRFAQAPSAQVERSRFDRSHGHKTTFDAMQLIPVFADEVVPGDTFTMDASCFARLATPLKPIMDNIFLDIHFFFVPYRLVWEHWVNFMGERDDPEDDPSDYTVPQATWTADDQSGTRLWNYFGIAPIGTDSVSYSVSALPFRAYGLIFNEWYRDQNLRAKFGVPTDDGPDAGTWEIAPFNRGKRHDYFTSCLPWPQKGDPVAIGIGGVVPILGIGVSGSSGNSVGVTRTYTQTDGTTFGSPNDLFWEEGLSFSGSPDQHIGILDGGVIVADNVPNIRADLSDATSVTINQLREAFQIQKLLERDARGGTRYIELILSHFGVKSSDARLQRPEYLGGSSTRVNINPVASTVSTEDTPQGNLAAVGSVFGEAGWQKSFEEHGIVIGIASARADITYQQGIERMWSRQTRYDFYWPAFSHLGEQPVYVKELYYQGSGAPTINDAVFGYQERYAEYRYKPSIITGIFNSNTTAPLDTWHLGEKFENLPLLNDEFITTPPPIDRVIAVPSEPHFIADFYFKLTCERPMPVYAVPGMIDHF